ncbi:unnamed protein product [Victoria cruziana]
MYPNLDLLLLLLLHWVAVMAILNVGIFLVVILLLLASFLILIAILVTDIYEILTYYPIVIYHLRNGLERGLVMIVFYFVEIYQNMGSSRNVPAEVRPLLDAVLREDTNSVAKHDEPGSLAHKKDEGAGRSADMQSPDTAKHSVKGVEFSLKEQFPGASVTADLDTDESNKELQTLIPKLTATPFQTWDH